MESDKSIKIDYLLEFNKIRLDVLKMNIKQIKKYKQKTKHASSLAKAKAK
jgi:hypothetical protein